MLVCHDEALRLTLLGWLAGVSDVQVMAEACPPPDEAAADAPDVILFGAVVLRLRDVQRVAQLSAQCPRSKVLIVSRHVDPDAVVIGAFRQGAWGYVTVADESAATMIDAVRTVSRGGAVLSSGLIRWMLDEIVQAQFGHPSKDEDRQ
jgi:DNA-binding NarL/FixJ family response regulator